MSLSCWNFETEYQQRMITSLEFEGCMSNLSFYSYGISWLTHSLERVDFHDVLILKFSSFVPFLFLSNPPKNCLSIIYLELCRALVKSNIKFLMERNVPPLQSVASSNNKLLAPWFGLFEMQHDWDIHNYGVSFLLLPRTNTQFVYFIRGTHFLKYLRKKEFHNLFFCEARDLNLACECSLELIMNPFRIMLMIPH